MQFTFDPSRQELMAAAGGLAGALLIGLVAYARRRLAAHPAGGGSAAPRDLSEAAGWLSLALAAVLFGGGVATAVSTSPPDVPEWMQKRQTADVGPPPEAAVELQRLVHERRLRDVEEFPVPQWAGLMAIFGSFVAAGFGTVKLLRYYDRH